MSSGRSRGRARVRTEPAPVPLGGGDSAEQPATPAQQPPLPPVTHLPATSTPALPTIPTTSAISSARAFPDSGRGRGIPKIEPTPTITTTTSGSGGSGSGSGSGSTTSPNGSPSEGSPPSQKSPHQHSPTETASAIPVPPHGRAALRGLIHKASPSARVDTGTGLSALSITGSDEPVPEVRPTMFESVLRTKPDNCTEKKGNNGSPIEILCNYFEVANTPDWELHQYHVDFSPSIDSKRLRNALFYSVADTLFPDNKAFDGSTVYSLTRLDDYTEKTAVCKHDQTMVQIKIKHVGIFVPTSPQFIHLFNLVFRNCLKKYGMKQIDTNYYDLENRIEIQKYGLQLINGFATSIASYEDKLLLCVEICNKLLHKTTVLDLLYKLYGESKSEGQFREACQRELIGRIIMTKYNNKTYKIDDINWEENPTTRFPIKGENMPLSQYYKKQYDITILDDKQPLVINLLSAKDKRRGLTIDHRLVPELCILTGVDDKMRLDYKFKKEVEQFSKTGSADRCNRSEDFIRRFSRNPDVKAELNKWKMSFLENASKIIARALPPESLLFGKNKTIQLDEKADWGNSIKGVALLKTIDLKYWVVIYPSSKQVAGQMFVKTYGDVIGGMAISADAPEEVCIRTDDPNSIIQTLKERIADRTQMVVVIVSSKRKDRYDAIKRICCLELPVPSQVVTSAIIEDEKKRRSVVTKVAIQMNCKLGGEVMMTNIPIKNIMICGIDTYHDSQKKKSSVCAFIATSNQNKTKFYSRASIQETHQELSSNLTLTFKAACEHYKKMNGVFPEKIIIYRDGVSDGQLALVKDSEIPQIEKAFTALDASYKPTMAVIIVKKRGNARFFTGRPTLGNPPCGTVIDSVVTRKEWFDFYLISQHVTQGTVNPTHYNIIHDTIGLKADHYQRLSYKLCHLYYNWPGTIRVPATCQYAHKLAFLVGQSLHKEHHASLSDKLFYL